MLKVLSNLKLETNKDEIKAKIYYAFINNQPDTVHSLIEKIALSDIIDLKLFCFKDHYFHLDGLSYRVITPNLNVEFF